MADGKVTIPLNDRRAPRASASLGLVGPAGEAVEHRAVGRAFGVEDGERLVPRLPRVDHERELSVVGDADLVTEDVGLDVSGRAVVVEVETTLADRHDVGIVEQGLETVGSAGRIVGMDAGGGPDVVESGGDLGRLGGVVDGAADRQQVGDPLGGGRRHHVGRVAAGLGGHRGEVAVVVEPHVAQPASSRGNNGAPRSRVAPPG